MASAKKADNPGVFDVSKPGKTTPDATSRPIIITNRPILQDPMMAQDKTDTEAKPAETKSNSAPKMTIKPITVTSPDDELDDSVTVTAKKTKKTDASEEPAPAASEPQLEKPAAETPAEPAADEKALAEEKPETPVVEPTPEEPEAETEKPAAKPTPVTEPETPAEPAADDTEEEATKKEDAGASDKPKEAQTPEEQEAAAKKAEEEAVAHQTALQKLVDSREYFLPINSIENRKTKRFVALGAVLIIVLGAAWVDIALDAGLIHITGVKAVTHFFTN